MIGDDLIEQLEKARDSSERLIPPTRLERARMDGMVAGLELAIGMAKEWQRQRAL